MRISRNQLAVRCLVKPELNLVPEGRRNRLPAEITAVTAQLPLVQAHGRSWRHCLCAKRRRRCNEHRDDSRGGAFSLHHGRSFTKAYAACSLLPTDRSRQRPVKLGPPSAQPPPAG
jgi:hypothetical protein